MLEQKNTTESVGSLNADSDKQHINAQSASTSVPPSVTLLHNSSMWPRTRRQITVASYLTFFLGFLYVMLSFVKVVLGSPVMNILPILSIGATLFIGSLVLYALSSTNSSYSNQTNISQAVQNVAKAKTVQDTAAAQAELLTSYYQSALQQSRNSFAAAFVIAIAGAILFGIIIVINQGGGDVAVKLIGAAGAGLVEVVAGLQFYLYSKTTIQLRQFLTPLEQNQRHLIAIAFANELPDGHYKNKVKAHIAIGISGLPQMKDDNIAVEVEQPTATDKKVQPTASQTS